MKRVLILATSRKTRGGITSVIKAYETGEQWKKYHCHWVQTHRDGPYWRKLLYLACAWVDFLIRIWFYEVIHVHLSLETTARRKKTFVQIAKFLNKKVILHLHCGSQIDDIWNRNYDYLFRAADVSLLLSDNLKRRVEKYMGIGRDFRVCYNPCPIISREPILPKENYILFSGTLYKGKGYQDLIKAFSMIAKKYSDWNLFFAGNGEVNIGKQIAKDCRIESQVKFLGWVSGEEKDKVFRKASVFCLPSYAEGFPMAVLDAWAYGLPVITTPVGGIPDIAKDGENLLLFTPGDINKLANCLEKLITNESLRETIAGESTKLAITTFNIKNICKQIDDLYNEIITKSPNS